MAMIVHWDSITKPILDNIKPCRIVEVGVYVGDHVHQLVEYLRENCDEGELVAIDPSPNIPQVNIDNWSDVLSLYVDLSLNVLPTLEDYDLIFIDGDHNYYTLNRELHIIDEHFKDKNYTPTIFCHDTILNGYEDHYFNLSTIPPEYVNNKPFHGLVPAINDFIKDSLLPWQVEWFEEDVGVAILYIDKYPGDI